MLKTDYAGSDARTGVNQVFFWIERDRPGVCTRWYLNHETPLIIQPGEPLDFDLDAAAFKAMMKEHAALQQAVSADVRHFLREFLRQFNPITLGGLLLLCRGTMLIADCLI
jgi:hypothetical protein